MIRFLRLLFYLFPLLLTGQITPDKTAHDFGNLTSYDERFVDFKFTNRGIKKGYVLRVVKPSEVIYIAKSNTLEKDSSIYLRFQVNPTRKGKFSYALQIYLSDRQEPLELTLTGDLAENPPSSGFLTECPDFNSRPAGKGFSFPLNVLTLDKATRKVLSDSKVTCIQLGSELWRESTHSDGMIKKEATVGFIYLVAQHDGYSDAEQGAYVNFQRNRIVLELEHLPETPAEFLSEQDTLVDVDPQLVEQEERKDTTEFSEEHYRPVNIVFVLDISSSMNQGDKLELMKYTLLQLAGLIRSCDHMGVVTYADQANILIPPTTGNEKNRLTSEISGLRAAGLTAGGTGIKLGFKEVLKNYDSKILNSLIVVTDGAFNKDSGKYQKAIRKYSKKGIELHVIGIKMKDSDAVKMTEVANLGRGVLIAINTLSDARNKLIGTIRTRSFIGPNN